MELRNAKCKVRQGKRHLSLSGELQRAAGAELADILDQIFRIEFQKLAITPGEHFEHNWKKEKPSCGAHL